MTIIATIGSTIASDPCVNTMNRTMYCRIFYNLHDVCFGLYIINCINMSKSWVFLDHYTHLQGQNL